ARSEWTPRFTSEWTARLPTRTCLLLSAPLNLRSAPAPLRVGTLRAADFGCLAQGTAVHRSTHFEPKGDTHGQYKQARFCVDGRDEAAGDREQGRPRGPRQRNGARIHL